MMITALITGLITATLILGGLILLIISLKRRIYRVITAFVKQPDEKTPSQLAMTVDQCSIILAQRLTNQIKTTLMGLASGDSKIAAREAMASATAGNPALATLLQLIPGVSRRLAKNPEILSFAGGLLSKIGNNGKTQQSDDRGNNIQLTM